MSIFEDRCVIRARYGRTAAIAWQVARGWSNITTTEIIWVRPKPFESLSELDYDVDALDAIDLERIEIRYTQDEHWLQVIGDAQNQDFVFLLEFPSHPSTQLVCGLFAVLTCLHSRVCVIVPYSFEDFLSLSIYTSNIYDVESTLNNDTRNFTEEQIIPTHEASFAESDAENDQSVPDSDDDKNESKTSTSTSFRIPKSQIDVHEEDSW